MVCAHDGRDGAIVVWQQAQAVLAEEGERDDLKLVQREGRADAATGAAAERQKLKGL